MAVGAPGLISVLAVKPAEGALRLKPGNAVFKPWHNDETW